MASEKRMIDANATVVAFTNWLTSTYDGRLPRDIVAEIPTVDAVEVVRCKDCQLSEPCDVDGRIWCSRMCWYMKEDGFCSEGV